MVDRHMKQVTLLDGSVGQELVLRSGKKPRAIWSTEVLLEKPEQVAEIHAEYFHAGASIATTNTYPVLRDRLESEGLEGQLETLWDRALKAAREARDNNGWGRVAGSIGPLVASYRPDECPPAKEAEVEYEEIVEALGQAADLLLIETMSSVDQADGAMRAANKASLPVWLAVTVDDFDGRVMRSGEPLSALIPLLERHRPSALLINCSRPEAVTTGLDIISGFGLPFGAYANGFTEISHGFVTSTPTVDKLKRRLDLDVKKYGEFAMDWIAKGASIVGGCCEIGPPYIKELAKRIRAAGHEIV